MLGGQGPNDVTAIVGGTLIDGHGGPSLENAAIVIVGKRISEVGPRESVEIPAGATVIDASGKFITPGFIDTNVHVSPYSGGIKTGKETSVKYMDRLPELTLEAAQMQLKFGVTTIRDSYGALVPLKYGTPSPLAGRSARGCS